MKSLQTLIAVLLGAACLVMAVATVATSRANVAKQAMLQQQQATLQQNQAMVQNEVRTLQNTDQMSRNVLTDLGNAAMKNEAIKALLSKHGYTLTSNAPPAGVGAVPVVTEQKAPALAPMDVKAESPAPKAEVVTPPVSAPVEPAANEVKKEEKP